MSPSSTANDATPRVEAQGFERNAGCAAGTATSISRRLGSTHVSGRSVDDSNLVDVAIETNCGTRLLRIVRGTRILFEALRVGVPLAYSCASGTCGSCVAQVTDGTPGFGWEEAPGLSARQRAAGKALLCQCLAMESIHVHARELPDQVKGRLTTPDYRAALLNRQSRIAMKMG